MKHTYEVYALGYNNLMTLILCQFSNKRTALKCAYASCQANGYSMVQVWRHTDDPSDERYDSHGDRLVGEFGSMKGVLA